VLAEAASSLVWAYGALVNQALEALERSQRRGVRVGVVDARFAKPLDEELLARHAQRYRWIVTLEEHQRAGGFGSAVLERRRAHPVARASVRVIGVPTASSSTRRRARSSSPSAASTPDGVERVVRLLLSPTLV
jgi:1-deoxy-D-xylulose-5-phosphate synthase